MAVELSIVVPTSGRPAALSRCLGGIARCHAPAGGLEVVVASAAPDPEVDAAVARARADGLDVTLLPGPDAGRPDGRNRAVAASSGRLIAFTDDDCIPEPGWATALVAALHREPDAVFGGVLVNGMSGNRWAEAAQVALDAAYDHFARNPDDAAAFFGTNNLALSRQTFDAVRGFDSAFVHAAEDRDLCDRARRAGHPLLRAPGAVVVHYHDLSARGLIRQQLSYGRGAVVLTRRRAAHGLAPLRIGRCFFVTLVVAPLRRRHGAGPWLLAATLLTQVAYSAGMLAEACRQRLR